jgi:hypothetical protein
MFWRVSGNNEEEVKMKRGVRERSHESVLHQSGTGGNNNKTTKRKDCNLEGDSLFNGEPMKSAKFRGKFYQSDERQ